MSENLLLGGVFAVGIIALLFAYRLVRIILKKPEGSEKVQEIADQIHKGAMTFLNKEYKPLKPR